MKICGCFNFEIILVWGWVHLIKHISWECIKLVFETSEAVVGFHFGLGFIRTYSPFISKIKRRCWTIYRVLLEIVHKLSNIHRRKLEKKLRDRVQQMAKSRTIEEGLIYKTHWCIFCFHLSFFFLFLIHWELRWFLFWVSFIINLFNL